MEVTARHTLGWANVAAVVGLLAFSNVMTNRVLPSPLYVPWSVGMSALLVWFAVKVDDRHPFELGFDPRALRSGLAWGGAVLGVILAGLLVGALLPLTRGLFEDDRVGDVSLVGMLYQTVLRIPLGTVLLEETAFRGVLLGMLMARTTLWRGVFWSSALFGVWHVLPAVGIEQTNPVYEDVFGGRMGPLLAVVGAVVFTAAAGYLFSFLRLRSGSIVAPVLLHVATNSLGFAVSWTVIRFG